MSKYKKCLEDSINACLAAVIQRKIDKMKDEITKKDFDFEDKFKESLIHQLWHLVEELKGVREELSKFNKVVEETNRTPVVTKEELMEFISKHTPKE